MVENTIIHEISLAGYKAASTGGMLDLGTWGSYGIEKLHLTLDAAWQDLTITAFFNVKGKVVAKKVVGKDGYADVPWEATKESTFAGRIVFEGSMNGQRRITTDLNYKVTNHSEITDIDPVPTDDRWNQFVTLCMEYRDGAFEAAERAIARAADAEAASNDAQAATRAAKASEAAAKASENATAASEDNARISAGAAAVSEGNTAASADKAKASENAAAESASNAAADATKAASAAKKAADESVSANIAAIEKMQADVASKQAAAFTSEQAAAASAVAAAGSATQAEAQKTAAAKSASDAQGYMQTAISAATNANTSAENAAGSKAAAASSATVAAGDAKTASDAAAVATDAKAAAVAAQKDAAASKAAAANSAADADRTANSINESMTQIAANKEAVNQLKEDIGYDINTMLNKSVNYVDRIEWENGTIDSRNGNLVDDTTGSEKRTKDFFPLFSISNFLIDFHARNYTVLIFKYNKQGAFDSFVELVNYDNENVQSDFSFDIDYDYKIVLNQRRGGEAILSNLKISAKNEILDYVYSKEETYTRKEIDAFIERDKKIVDELKEDTTALQKRQNVLVGSETGNPVSCNDAFAAPLCGLTAYGKSTQGNTTGAQLFDVSNADVVHMYIANSGIGNYIDNYSVIIPIKPSTSYTISEKNNKVFRAAITEEYPVEAALTLFKYVTAIYKNITTPNNLPNGNFLMIQLYGSFSHAPDFSGLMLSEGSTTKPWEPYTGGKPSPSPDYPQEIKSAGDGGSLVVKVSDGNGKEQTLTLQTPTGLPGIPVTSGGNYTDPQGQQWVCDEVDLERGVMVQRIDKAAFDSTKTLTEQNAILTTPIETPLTPAEIAAYKALITYAPDTVVQASDGAGVKLEYQRDVNIAIKKLEDAIASMTTT